MKNKVSIIIPVYNVEKYLRQCLESITNQTLKEIEIICINDGSKDNSLDILKEFESQDDRIVLVDKQNGGYGAACNLGFEIASGEYIGIVEPDDFIDKYMYEKLYNLAKEENADVVKSPYFDYFDETEEEKIKKIDWNETYGVPVKNFRIQDYPQFFYYHPSVWSCIYRTDFLKENNINFVEAKGAGWVDNPFQFETLCLAKKLTWTDEAFYFYRYANPTSSSVLKDFSIPFDRCDEIHNFLKSQNIFDPNIRAYLYKRELNYIDIVLEGVDINNLKDVKYNIEKMISRMDKNIIDNHPAITQFEKNMYKGLALSLTEVYTK